MKPLLGVSCGCLLIALAVQSIAAEPVTIAPANPQNPPRQPQVEVTSNGRVYITYGAEGAIYCAVSTDGGRHFGEPVRVGVVPDLMLGMRRGPRVAANGAQAVITAIGREGQLLAWRSSDGGRHWQGPVTVNDEPNSAREGLHDLAAGPDGRFYTVWLDLRVRKSSQIYGAASEDGGKTWSQNRLVYRSPDGSVCPCCHPSVVFDAGGKIYVMWRNDLDGNRDLYVSTSTDGKTFGKADKLGAGSWEFDRCPMDGGHLAVAPNGQMTTIWRRDKQIFRTLPDHPREQLLGSGEQPWAATGPDGAYLTWISKRGGDLFVLTPQGRHPRTIAHNAIDPVIAAPLDGHGPVVIVWETGRGKESSLHAAVVGD